MRNWLQECCRTVERVGPSPYPLPRLTRLAVIQTVPLLHLALKNDEPRGC